MYDIVLEYLLEQSKPLGNLGKSYLFHEDKINEWIPHPEFKYCLNYRDEPGHVDRLQNLIISNYSNTTLQNADKDSFLVYHCTSWFYAMNIADIGVDYLKGRRCLDFGIAPGFYTTRDVHMARAWGKNNMDRWRKEVVILVFRVLKKSLKEFKVIEFQDESPKWQSLITSSRKFKAKENMLDRCDIVYGPVCKNPHDVVRKNSHPVAHHNMFQLVLKSRKADAWLTENLVGSIWFSKSTW
jgi:hypothetical protein